MYAVIDIESTGGSYNDERIIELAIFRFDGNQVVDRFVSLVNPQRSIPPYVKKLTGISQQMVLQAPLFEEIASDVFNIIKGCTLVGHGVDFDYRVLKLEFNNINKTFEVPLIDTLTLSKLYFKKMPSYALNNLCQSLGIEIKEHHRAQSDAYATLKLWQRLLSLQLDLHQITKKSIKIFKL